MFSLYTNSSKYIIIVMINYSISNETNKILEWFSKPSKKFGHICYETLNTSEKINISIEHRYSNEIQMHNFKLTYII